MKAQELRIGNIVEYLIRDEMDAKKEWWEPSQIDAQDILWLSQNPDDEDYRPMTITEELLVRFGFVLTNKIWSNGIVQLGYFTQEVYFEFEFKFPFTHWGRNKIQYVHELQNLCFALTGEELTTTPIQ